MFCKNCGSTVRETSKFCGGCGARVEADSATRPQQPTPSRSAVPAAPRHAAAPARSQTGARPPARPTAPAQPRTPASPPKLRFHTLLEYYLAAEGWDDELEVDAEARSVTLNTGIGTGNLEFSLIIEASDQTECVDAYVYYRRVKCKESRLSEMCQLFNLIHIESRAFFFRTTGGAYPLVTPGRLRGINANGSVAATSRPPGAKRGSTLRRVDNCGGTDATDSPGCLG